jgi:hypothetical protein
MNSRLARVRAVPHRLGISTLAAAVSVLAIGPSTATAQKYRISQRATVSQMLGSTRVSLDYSRPLARGRSDLFGGVVHWGELWTPGANEATVLETSDTLTLNGHSVPTGRWSMWVIPSQVGPWELVLDKRDSLFHTQRPELKDDQIRFPLEVRSDAPHTEALVWTFPRIAQDGATMRLNWATMQIDVEVGVKSIEPVITVAADEAAQYVGKWQVTFKPNPETGKGPPPTILTVTHTESGMLRATFPPGAFGPPPPPKADSTRSEATMSPQERERAEAKRKLAAFEQGDFSYVLVPRARGVFMMGWYDDGMLYDVEEFFHEFELENGRAVSITFRDDKDRVMATATRVKP